jgi:hypothetical protein
VVLERLLDGRRRLLAPDGVDQLVGGDHLVAVEQQLGEEHAVLDAAEPQGAAAPAGLERPEEQVFDRGAHSAARSGRPASRPNAAAGLPLTLAPTLSCSPACLSSGARTPMGDLSGVYSDRHG